MLLIVQWQQKAWWWWEISLNKRRKNDSMPLKKLREKICFTEKLNNSLAMWRADQSSLGVYALTVKSLTSLFVFHLPTPSPLLFRYILTSAPSAIFIYFILFPLYFCAVCVRCHNLTLILPFHYSLRPFLFIYVRALIRYSALARGMLPAPVTTLNLFSSPWFPTFRLPEKASICTPQPASDETFN